MSTVGFSGQSNMYSLPASLLYSEHDGKYLNGTQGKSAHTAWPWNKSARFCLQQFTFPSLCTAYMAVENQSMHFRYNFSEFFQQYAFSR